MVRKLLAPLLIYRGLPRSVYVLFFARMVNSMGNFVFPFLTMFLTDRMGMSPADAGFFIFLSSSTFVPGSIVGGKIADHFGRKKVIIISQFLAAVFFIPCAFLGTHFLVPWLILMANLCLGAARPAMNAMVTDLTVPENRQAGFSFTYLGHNIGFALGLLFAGFLYKYATEWLFLGDALTTLLAIVLVFIFIPESVPSREAIEESFSLDSEERGERGSSLGALLRRPFLFSFVLITVLTHFVYAQHLFALPLQMNRMFTESGPVFYGYLMSTNAFMVVFCTAPFIALTRRFRPIVNQIFASILYAAGFGILFAAQSFPLYVVSTLIWTAGEILSVTNVSVYIANHTPMTHRGRFNSLIPIITGVGFSVSPALMGYFLGVFQVQWVWPLTAGLSLIAAAGYCIVYALERRKRALEIRKQMCVQTASGETRP